MSSNKPLQRLFAIVFFFIFFVVPFCSEAISAGTDHEFVSMFSDQRQLLLPGSAPVTAIETDYEKYPEFQGIMPKLFLDDAGKKSVVEAEVQDGKLRLQWKKAGISQIILRIENPNTDRVFYNRIKLEAWTPDYWTMFFSVLGGLGMFLLGMRFMSDGLQLIAGAGLRKIIATVADNRFSAVFVGLGVTSVIQSSSVTTVMVVGFINSQIMTLSQGIGIIMGANIGTTMTGWILAINIGKYGLHMIGVASLIYLFSKVERTRFLAMSVLGLGLVFFGLELMQYGFVPLRDLPEFSARMKSFAADTQQGVYFCIAVGCLLTLIVQSSSAMLGVTISLAAIGVIRFDTAAALVLGENIGTTITAVLASIGSSINAKRAAYFHVMFNIIGVLWISCIFRWLYLPMIIAIVGVDPVTGEIRDPKVGIALTHTIFNVVNTIGDAAHQQLRMADELESISDYLIVILKSDIKLRKNHLAIPEPQKAEFKELHTAIESYLSMILWFYSARRADFADLTMEVHAQGQSLNRKAKETRDKFVKRMSDERFDAFNTQFNAYRRVREHAKNVAEAIVGLK